MSLDQQQTKAAETQNPELLNDRTTTSTVAKDFESQSKHPEDAQTSARDEQSSLDLHHQSCSIDRSSTMSPHRRDQLEDEAYIQQNANSFHQFSNLNLLGTTLSENADDVEDLMPKKAEVSSWSSTSSNIYQHQRFRSKSFNDILPNSSSSCSSNNNKIRLGVCAMDKKSRSKPMHEILSRLDEHLFNVIFFGNDCILNTPIEEWPLCDVLIAFFSTGFPLEKAEHYVELRRPFCINDLSSQRLLLDRRHVYDLLQRSGVEVPRHVFVNRDDYVSTFSGSHYGTDIQEFDDHIVVNGFRVDKPFVEKPADAENHNIRIYYPSSAGGGCKKLFRKIGDRSSDFCPQIDKVRRDGRSYIYEEYVNTQGVDVKLYTVGPDYGHAEARKSPTVDGKVERGHDGKEVRFPVILSYREKEIARRIVLVFKQFVCGFDILRVQRGDGVVSYVCDVNGWSFVKKSRKYYEDCSQILQEHMLALVKPAALKTFSTLNPLVTTSSLNRRTGATFAAAAIRQMSLGAHSSQRYLPTSRSSHNSLTSLTAISDAAFADATSTLLHNAANTLGDMPVHDFSSHLTSLPASLSSSVAGTPKDIYNEANEDSNEMESHQEELRCVIAIVRHGDRTPKQKVKIDMKEPRILKYFHKHSPDPQKDLKVKAKAPLTEFLQVVKEILSELPRNPVDENLRHQLLHIRDVLERWKIVGLNRKVQIAPRAHEEYTDTDGVKTVRCTEVRLVLKWGGELTKLGERQSIHLGCKLRHELYPDPSGGGILRLHSTFRHDLKIKTSDEGRVMKTAAAFAKGLLELEGDLPPILVSLVHKEKGSMHMLDPSGNKEAKLELDELKKSITANLQRDIEVNDASEEDLERLVGPKELVSLRDALQRVGNPRKSLIAIHETMRELLVQLDEMLDDIGSGDERVMEEGDDTADDVALSGVVLYKGETLMELTERWRFIFDRLYDGETDRFDLSRIPDVHDNVRFDVLHNPHLGLSEILHRLYDLAKAMADCVVPQEYGTTFAEKRSVGLKICYSLLEKIKYDLNVARSDNEVDMRYMINMDYAADLPINTMGRRVRTRLYFSSESHLHSLLNTFRFASPSGSASSLLSEEGMAILNETPELCYLTHVVMRVFEDSRPEMVDKEERFRLEILFSPGATATPFHMSEMDRDNDASRFDTAPLQVIGRDQLTCIEVEAFFQMAIQEGQMSDTCDVISP